MAQSISDQAPKRGRGRPKGSVAPKAAKAAAALADEIVTKTGNGKVATVVDLDPIGVDADPVRAPAFGKNEPDEAVFIKYLQREFRDLEAMERVKLQLKELRGLRKDHRNEAKAAGIVLGDLDYVIKRSQTEDVDIAAEFERRRLYAVWAGLDIGEQAALPVDTKQPEDAEKTYWFKRGSQAGRQGKERGAYPDGIPPERKPDFLSGWDHGQEIVMKHSPLTSGAFAEGASKAEAVTKVLVLNESHFQAPILLEDANLKTLLPQFKEAFWAAETVAVQFNGARRVIREPDPELDGGYYNDTGEQGVPVSIAEPIKGEDEAAAFA